MSRFQDVLPSDSDDSSSEGEANAEEVKLPSKKPAPGIPRKDLEQLGFKGGPSILYVPEPASTEEQSWDWAKGRTQDAEAEETPEQRAANREAASAEASAALAKATQEQRAVVRQGAAQERRDLKRKNDKNDKNLTFQQREKKKRDAGQAKSSKNYVEEEKRLARNAGVYHGFDS